MTKNGIAGYVCSAIAVVLALLATLLPGWLAFPGGSMGIVRPCFGERCFEGMSYRVKCNLKKISSCKCSIELKKGNQTYKI